MLRKILGAKEEATAERRQFERFPAEGEAFCQVPPSDSLSWSAQIKDVSCGGIRLLVHREVPADAVLRIEMPGAEHVLHEARVIHISADGPSKWTLGCEFSQPLSADEVKAYREADPKVQPKVFQSRPRPPKPAPSLADTIALPPPAPGDDRPPTITLPPQRRVSSHARQLAHQVFLGRYETVKLLGEGGMGCVFLARDPQLGRHVVVKVMHEDLASDPRFCEQFQKEMLLMARFQHPYAVTLHDASLKDPKGPCIIMEFVPGVTLDELRRNNRGRLSPARISRLLGQLCEVLQVAHTRGIIHLDLKPANLMIVDADSPQETVKVMDFGLAEVF